MRFHQAQAGGSCWPRGVQEVHAIGEAAQVQVHQLGTVPAEAHGLHALSSGVEHLDLLRPIYKKTAAYGHFGRTESEFTWEKTDKVEALKAKAK